MRRRDLLALGPLFFLPAAARGQPISPRPLVAWFGSSSLSTASRYIGYLKEGLDEVGYREGRDFDFLSRFAEYKLERLPVIAAEIINLGPTVIVVGATDTAVAAKRATSTIPIVCGALADPIELGLIASYAHPAGNVTGVMPYVDGLPAKQMELAREMVRGATKIGVLGNLNDPKAPPQQRELENAAQLLGIELITPEVNSPEDLAGAVASLVRAAPNVVIVLQTVMLLNQRSRVAELLSANRLAAVYGYREHVDGGGLISYGVDLRWCFHRAGSAVHKILNGAKPAELPVEFPTKLQLVINLKTAKELGIEMPRSLLARADEVIE